MKAVALASNSIGVAGIRSLVKQGFSLAAVFTPDKSSPGKDLFDSVAAWCASESIDCKTAPGDPSELASAAKALGPEIVFSFDFSGPLEPLIGVAGAGLFRLHPAVPQGLGWPSPVRRALLRSEKKSGVTLHSVLGATRAGIVEAKEIFIGKEETAKTLYLRLAREAETLLDDVLPALKAGSPAIEELDFSGNILPEVSAEEGKLDWKRRSFDNYNVIRAMTQPYSGAYSTFLGEKAILWWAVPDDTNQGLLHPGEIEVDEGKTLVGTSYGALRIEELEWKGRLLTGPEVAEALGPHELEKFI